MTQKACCDMITVLGRLCGDALFSFSGTCRLRPPGQKKSCVHHRSWIICVFPASDRQLAAENDPWRFRQQSSRVISIQFWYLTSWLPRFLLDQTLCFYTMAMQNLYLLGGFLRVCFGSYYLGSLSVTCTLVSPLCTCMIAPEPGFCKRGYSIN